MFSHGILAGLLFATVGRMVYDRTHTRDLGLLEQAATGQGMPFAAWLFVIAGMASMGLPGFSGFVAEVQVLVGAWRAFPGLHGRRRRHRGGRGLHLARRAFFSDAPALDAQTGVAVPVPEYEPVTWAEKLACCCWLERAF
jgi:NADH-quinone oxidoreductase subunit M